MAYDPNDAADKAIVDGLINDALEAERDTHIAEVGRLTAKNTELLGKLRTARNGSGGENAEEINRLENELEATSGKLRTTETELRETGRKLKAAEGERDTFRATADTESNFSRNMLVENALTTALVENKVAPHFMEAARALLKDRVKVEIEGGERKTLVDGKPVADFIKDWSASDAGKHYVSAPANGGGGAPTPNGGTPPNGSKKLADLTEAERGVMATTDPVGWATLLASEGPQTNIATI